VRNKNAQSVMDQTLLMELVAGEGVDLKTLQTIAGHSSFKTTMDIYVKPRTDKITAAGEMMDTLLNGYAS